MEESKLTNSTIGRYHWFHTLMSFQRHLGEFLKNNEIPNEEFRKTWGKTLEENTIELLEGYKYINTPL